MIENKFSISSFSPEDDDMETEIPDEKEPAEEEPGKPGEPGLEEDEDLEEE